MKKHLIFMCAVSLLASMTACGAENADSTTSSAETAATAEGTAPAETEGNSIEVDEGFFTVDLTVPASFIDDLDATVKEAEENEGVVDYKVNDDGSITYTYEKSEYDRIIKGMRAGFDAMVADQLASGNYTTLSSIEGDDSLRSITLTVTNEADYGKTWDGAIIIGLYMYTGYYQIFSGEAETEDDIKTTFHFVDGATGVEFNTTIYPDHLTQE